MRETESTRLALSTPRDRVSEGRSQAKGGEIYRGERWSRRRFASQQGRSFSGANGAERRRRLHDSRASNPWRENPVAARNHQSPDVRGARCGRYFAGPSSSKALVEDNIMAIRETFITLRAGTRLRKSRRAQHSGCERARRCVVRGDVAGSRLPGPCPDRSSDGTNRSPRDPSRSDIQPIAAGLRHRGIGLITSQFEQTLDIVDRAYIMLMDSQGLRTVRAVFEEQWLTSIFPNYARSARDLSREERYPPLSPV